MKIRTFRKEIEMFYKKDDSGYKTPLPGVRFKSLVYGQNTHLCEFHLEKGRTIPMHKHPHEQTGYLVSGRMTFTIEGKQWDARPGDSWSISGNLEHGVEVLEEAVVIEVFSPVREDYL
jgi:quercetin dioxygenase-like cupin family protein